MKEYKTGSLSPLSCQGTGEEGNGQRQVGLDSALHSVLTRAQLDRLGDSGKETEAMPIPYLGCPCLRVVTASQGVGPRLAWAWEGGGYLGPSQEGRKRPQALLDRGMTTPHLCAPCCLWLTAQAILRCGARGNPGLSGGGD